jgi:DHA2 family multidrug resistance protein-like MFS transporter
MFLDPDQRTVAIGVWIASFSAGAAIGPLVGGALLEHLWWGSVFLVAVPAMALLLVLGPRLLPEFRDPEAGRLDLTSATLSLVAVLAVIYGLKQIAQDGLGWLLVMSISTGLALGVVFFRRQRTLADPLIDLQLFRLLAFSATLTINTLVFFVNFGAFLFIAQYLQLVLGLSPLQAGLWTLPYSGGFIIGSLLTPIMVRRVRPAFVMAGGFALAATGFGLLTQVGDASGLAVLVIGSVALSLGLAPATTLATDILVGSAPPERAGAASGISETTSELGGALGIAVLGSIGIAVYRSQVADAVPADAPPETAEAAHNTLGGAVAAAGQLPDRVGADLLETAREAFTHGLHLTAITSAALALGMAILAVALLRHVPTGSELEDQADMEPAGAVAGGAGIEKVLGCAAEVQDNCAPRIGES